MAVATSTTAPTDASSERPDWNVPSAAALTWIQLGTGLLALGALLWVITAVQQVSPGWLTFTDAVTFGRLRGAAITLVVWGGLGMAATGAALDVTRRLTRVPVQLEAVAKAAGGLMTLSVLGGTASILAGFGTGRPGLELSRPFAIGVALAQVLVAVVLMRTLAMREDDTLHPALWHIAAAIIAAPVLLLLGSVPRLGGVNDDIVRVFAVSGLQMLWLESLAIGFVLYVVPASCRTPLHSGQLAAIGFWGWVALAPFAGPVRLLSGPGQEWLETIGAAASIALLVPALAIAANVFRTYAARTARTSAPELRFALLATAMLVVAGIGMAVYASRTAGDLLHATVFAEGMQELVVLGVAASGIAAGVFFALPSLTGSTTANPRVASAAAWYVGIGAAVAVTALAVAGYVQGALWSAAVRTGGDTVTGAGWLPVGNAIRPLLWLRVAGDALALCGLVIVFQQVFSTAASADAPAESSTQPGTAPARG